MDGQSAAFTACRPKLHAIAYRMLGSAADAEDAVQDAWLRWNAADHAAIHIPEAWLVTTVTRLCLDRLRHAKLQREAYVGPWLPEPLVSAAAPSPEDDAMFKGEVSLAFMLLLERLSPAERAVFLLHDVFDHGYAEIAEMLGKTAAGCRQTLHRARERLQEGRQRYVPDADTRVRLLGSFVRAAQTGNRSDLVQLFADDAMMTSDGGGKAIAVLKVLHGADRLARLFHAIAQTGAREIRHEHVYVNGEPGLLRFTDGKLDTAFAFDMDDRHIRAVYAIRNPDKLARIACGDWFGHCVTNPFAGAPRRPDLAPGSMGRGFAGPAPVGPAA
ncbi:MAG TPA: RNA polymerase sigma-70 factor [Noviherbaspirillum sp.]|jgi:RNA polymerase sigma-70 factor (ECF subfamily)|uniref:RNA polymerase sigma-70 factor n=1 Tax=Noviherbaspirillum sp. TaxID=1926288 RepID=UPI002F92C9B1